MLAPSGRRYEDFRMQVPGSAALLDHARDICLSLGDNVVEDVRMHRVVFCKSVTFRWFADVEPRDGGIVVKIQMGRKEAPRTVQASDIPQVSSLEGALRDAYERIR